MANTKKQFLSTLKLEIIQDINQKVKTEQIVPPFENYEKLVINQFNKISSKNLKLFEHTWEEVFKMIDNLAYQFYYDCKQVLYSSLKKAKSKFVNQNFDKFLNKLFSFIEVNYLKPIHKLLFLKNSLGLNSTPNQFLLGTDISIPTQTKVFIEIRVELALRIVNSFDFYEVE